MKRSKTNARPIVAALVTLVISAIYILGIMSHIIYVMKPKYIVLIVITMLIIYLLTLAELRLFAQVQTVSVKAEKLIKLAEFKNDLETVTADDAEEVLEEGAEDAGSEQ